MKVSIIGSGIVGKSTGLGLLKKGNFVIFHDIVKEKVLKLKKLGYETTDSISEAVLNSNVSFICVQTPTTNGHLDLSYMEKAVIAIGKTLRKKNAYHVIAIRSTLLPSTTRTKIIPLLEQHSNLEVGKDFGVCVNPEFLRKETALNDFLNPWRVVIGEIDTKSGNILERLYLPFKAPIIRTDIDTAEMIKYVANTFLATRISFFNEMYLICNKLGLDPHFVGKVVSLDPRIGTYGVKSGRPFKGNCLPKDLEAMISFLKNKGINPKVLDATLYVNNEISKNKATGDSEK